MVVRRFVTLAVSSCLILAIGMTRVEPLFAQDAVKKVSVPPKAETPAKEAPKTDSTKSESTKKEEPKSEAPRPRNPPCRRFRRKFTPRSRRRARLSPKPSSPRRTPGWSRPRSTRPRSSIS